MAASMTRIAGAGVPVESTALSGLDSLLSIVQMPAGIPVGRWRSARPAPPMRACSPPPCLATSDEALAARLEAWRAKQTDGVATSPE
jgi:5-(carboxyamino)imidazole ribonucleotide mutase